VKCGSTTAALGGTSHTVGQLVVRQGDRVHSAQSKSDIADSLVCWNGTIGFLLQTYNCRCLTAAAPDGGRARIRLVRNNRERPPRVSRRRYTDRARKTSDHFSSGQVEASCRSSQRLAAAPRCRGLRLPGASQRFDLGRGSTPRTRAAGCCERSGDSDHRRVRLGHRVLLNSGA